MADTDPMLDFMLAPYRKQLQERRQRDLELWDAAHSRRLARVADREAAKRAAVPEQMELLKDG